MNLSSVTLAAAQQHELGGRLVDAAREYADIGAAAEAAGDATTLADATRRLGKVRYRQEGAAAAAELFHRSYAVAVDAGEEVLAAEALNALAVLELERGEYAASSALLEQALARGEQDASLRARVAQNLGIIANIRGDWGAALAHYTRSIRAFRAAGDQHGCALACHNLGMLSADRGLWKSADRYYRRSMAAADAAGDIHLRGLCLLNLSEVHIARHSYADALRDAEAALQIFDHVGAHAHRADANRTLGVIYRGIGATRLAEHRLVAARALAAAVDARLAEAESSRELALLYQMLGRSQDALRMFHVAHRIFGGLDARVDLVDVAAKIAELEAAYLTLVHGWGQSIESADRYTYDHCERVASYAVTIGGALGLAAEELTAIRFGAYLHDVGKVRIPPEILNKPGRLTPAEIALMQQHTIFGVELLAGVEFPWDIKPMIRSHHERIDGTGYPDHLAGDEIPLAAQIICVADVWDALTTARSYRPAMTPDRAMDEMQMCRDWWRPDVFDAFLTTLG